MKLLQFVIALTVLMSGSCSLFASEFTCKRGGSVVMDEYQHAIDLLGGGRLTIDEEEKVIRILKKAVQNSCKHAALALVDIKVNQAAALPKGTPQNILDQYDDEVYLLLIEATKIGEGYFELGNFYLTEDSKYYSPKKAKKILERSANTGDVKSIEFLINVYENGIGGISQNRARAQYWKSRMSTRKVE